MSYEIPIDKLPSQILGVTLEGAGYFLQLRDVNGLVLADIEVNGTKVISGAKCLPNQKIMPYGHLTAGGNFYFYCQDNEYPDYTKFGADHRLLFLTDAEIVELPNMQDL